MRCRDGRLQYPGILTFLVIALPMMIILINDVIGEAIVDAAIPALYSAILALGAFLYSISLAALLITFCLALVALNYWRFVYHPASVAHSRRKDKLRRLQYEGHSTSKFNRLRHIEFMRRMKSSQSTSKQSIGYCRKSFNVMKHSIQHGITLLSFRRIQNAKKLATTKKWCNKNRPPLSQGTVGSKEGSLLLMSPDNVTRRFGEVRSMHRVPENIINMLAAASSPALVEGKQRRFSFEAPPMRMSSDSSEHVVISASQMNNRRILNPYLLFSSEEAISLLRSRLFESHGRGVAGHMDIAEGSLDAEFRLMLDIFYPDGVALSSAEKTEAYDQYNAWKNSASDDFTLILDEATAIKVRMIPFSMFEEWFSGDILTILQNNFPDRLLDSSLRHIPSIKKRLARRDAMILRPDSRTHMKSPTVTTPQQHHIPLEPESRTI